MFIYFLISLAFVALLQEKILLKYGRDQNRRGVMGGELARYLLDKLAASQIAVEGISGWERFRLHSVGELTLSKTVYEGRTLGAIAEAARETVLKVQKHGRFLSFDQARRLWLFLGILILPAWGILLLGAVSGLEAVRFLAQDFFLLVFLMAVVDMAQAWEAEGHAAILLKQSGYFEVDELIKIRRLSEALRVEKMMMIYKAPLVWIKKIRRGREEAHGL